MKTTEMFPGKAWNGSSFEDVNAAALNAYPGLLQSWFPAGHIQGHEFHVGKGPDMSAYDPEQTFMALSARQHIHATVSARSVLYTDRLEWTSKLG